MTEELKPCPFCGGEASAVPDPNHSTGWEIGRFSNFCDVEPNVWAVHKSTAEMQWNTRTDLAQAAIAAAMMGAVRLADGIAGNTKDYNRDYRRAAGQIGALIKASISTDTAAALAEIKRHVRDQALEEAACVLEHALDAAGNTVTANTKRLVYAELGASIRDMKGNK